MQWHGYITWYWCHIKENIPKDQRENIVDTSLSFSIPGTTGDPPGSHQEWYWAQSQEKPWFEHCEYRQKK